MNKQPEKDIKKSVESLIKKVNPMVILASIPPQKNIKCDNCNYSGYRIA